MLIQVDWLVHFEHDERPVRATGQQYEVATNMLHILLDEADFDCSDYDPEGEEGRICRCVL
jgi:hypothetical protein